MIRARLAAFVAAAIVFAPGAGFGDDSAERQRSNLAAHMLAPTFDELQVAAYNSAAFAKKTQKQTRRHSQAFIALALLVGAACFANSRFRGLLNRRLQHHIRLFTTSLRDRGPPHLQLA